MRTDPIAWFALALALAATAAAVIALLPGAALPAWPSVGAGTSALVLALGRGRAGLRAVAAIAGSTAAVLGAAQIGALWLFSAVLPGGAL